MGHLLRRPLPHRAWGIRSSLLLAGALALATSLPGVGSAIGAPAPAAAVAAAAQPTYSPTSRTLAPTGIYNHTGTVTNPLNVLSGNDTRISGAGSTLTLDFGKEVGGLATLSFGATSDANQRVGLAFSESSLYVGTSSDASSGGNPDGAIHGAAPANGGYVMPTARLRGGFRYLTVFLDTSGWVDLRSVSLNFTAAPGKADPSAYANYFSSNDPLLNKIWYAGAYTVQLSTIAPNQGRAWGPPASEWDNSATVSSVGTSVLTDAAKRDRTIWSGDLGVALPSEYASTNDVISTRNALTTLFGIQASNGELPYAGPPWTNMPHSDTYHTWALLGSSTYYSYSGDRAWLDSVWAKYKLGMTYIAAKIDANGLLDVTGTADWARGGQGGENIQANALLYATLMGGANLATVEGDTALAATYTNRAATLKAAANSRLWDASAGLYRDNPTSTLYPQDGNSLAVWYGLSDSAAKSKTISQKLATRWNRFGALTPEWNGGVHPFIGGMELAAHFSAGDDTTALEQIRRTWGHMLNSPIGTRSTFWEGIGAGGGLAYGGSFMSLAHGWSSGPTFALTFNVLGTAPGATPGQYQFVPHPGDLTSVEGRITLPQGALNASWSRNPAAGTFSSHLVSPAGSSGRIGVPKLGGSNLSITVNGATVWSGGTFTARPGITGAGQDDAYVYLTGVAAGTYDLAATGLGTGPLPAAPAAGPQELPTGFTLCAPETGSCSFSGSRTVAYGAGEAYKYQVMTGGTACTSAAFGTDPAPDVLKSCYLAPLGGPAGYTLCSVENASCAVPAFGRDVAYGANGAFSHRVITSTAGTSTPCTNAVFGDPIENTVKSCYLAPAGGPSADWTPCAAETGSCATLDGQPVAYGAFGSFRYAVADGPIACTTAAFGSDPVPGEAKACYTRTATPPGFPVACATESGTCAFSGTRTVAYGARGAYVYRTFTGGTACTTAAFGADPLRGVVKSCYRVSAA
jgi:hypothetical protein